MLTPSGRRRAERFAELLDGAPALRGDAPLAPFATLGERLRDAGHGTTATATMDPLARDRLRMRLMAVGAVQGIGAGSRSAEADAVLDDAPRRQVVSSPRKAIVATAALVGVVGLTALGTSSSDAVPGDPLYAIKRSTESAQLELARSDVSRGQLHLEFAKTRLDEAQLVAEDPKKLDAALGEMDAETTDALRLLGTAAVKRQDRAPLDTLDDTVRKQRDGLSQLITTLPTNVKGRALDSLILLNRIEQRSKALRAALFCTTGYAGEPTSDALGPVPRSCAALPAGGRSDPTAPQGSTPGTPGTPGTVGGPAADPGPGAPPAASAPGTAGAPAPAPTPESTQGAAGTVLAGVAEVIVPPGEARSTTTTSPPVPAPTGSPTLPLETSLPAVPVESSTPSPTGLPTGP